MERWTGRVAVVTGASVGIGAAIAVHLANAGLTVVGLARRQHLIDDLKKAVSGPGSLHSRKCDVSNSDEVAETFAWVNESFGGTDLMVNNAGVIYHGTILTGVGAHELSVEELFAQIDVNVKSVALCSRHAAKSMMEREFPGHIININSIAGHYIPAVPIFNVYTGSKHAVTAISQTLLNEFSHFKVNIKTTSLSPGLVQTEMAQINKMPELREMALKEPALRPDDIAEAVLYLLSTPPHVNIDELTITPLGGKRL